MDLLNQGFGYVYVVPFRGTKVTYMHTDDPKRAKNGAVWFIGGKIEKGEGVIEAANREIKEETGVDAQIEIIYDVMILPRYGKVTEFVPYLFVSISRDLTGKRTHEGRVLEVECNVLCRLSSGRMKSNVRKITDQITLLGYLSGFASDDDGSSSTSDEERARKLKTKSAIDRRRAISHRKVDLIDIAFASGLSLSADRRDDDDGPKPPKTLRSIDKAAASRVLTLNHFVDPKDEDLTSATKLNLVTQKLWGKAPEYVYERNPASPDHHPEYRCVLTMPNGQKYLGSASGSKKALGNCVALKALISDMSILDVPYDRVRSDEIVLS